MKNGEIMLSQKARLLLALKTLADAPICPLNGYEKEVDAVMLLVRGTIIEAESAFRMEAERAAEHPAKLDAINEALAKFRVREAAPDLLATLETLLALAQDGTISRHETGKPTWHLTNEVIKLTTEAITKAKEN